MIISVITLNVQQFLPFCTFLLSFIYAHFCIVFNFSTTLAFFIFVYLFVYLLVVLYITRALCMTQWGLLFFQKHFCSIDIIYFVSNFNDIYLYFYLCYCCLSSFCKFNLLITKFLRIKADIDKIRYFFHLNMRT